MTELLLSAVTTVWGLGGIGLLVAAAAAIVYLPRAAPYLLVAALACGALGYVDRLQDDLDAAEAALAVSQVKLQAAVADVARLAITAQDNADSAKALANDNEAAALAYAADAEQARSDRDEIDLARQAAAIAAKACEPAVPIVGDPVHGALQGRPVREDDGLSPSMKAALQALQTKGRHR